MFVLKNHRTYNVERVKVQAPVEPGNDDGNEENFNREKVAKTFPSHIVRHLHEI